jgi:ElaB/YqjD/DUF883 family membrane-anchored ribosome-binding protein
MQARGKFDEAAGVLQEKAGEVREQAHDLPGEIVSFTRARPLTALGVTLGAGLLAGLLMRGRASWPQLGR